MTVYGRRLVTVRIFDTTAGKAWSAATKIRKVVRDKRHMTNS